jgi:hypothetical protein
MAGKQFISAKKAARVTGQPVRTISRFCESHRQSKYVRFEDGIYRIRLDFLVRHFGLAPKLRQVSEEEEVHPEPAPAPTTPVGLISLLEAQLAEKDRQLAARDAQLGQLIERNREQNNIIYSLEQSKQALETRLSLSLPERTERPVPVTEGPQVNYVLIGLAVLLAGLVLMILYGLLLGE